MDRDIASQLARLSELRKSGDISDAEYERAKELILQEKVQSEEEGIQKADGATIKTEKPKRKGRKRYIVLLAIVGFVIYVANQPNLEEQCGDGDQSACEKIAKQQLKAEQERQVEEAEAAKKLAAQVEEQRKGFHCLSAWDGSHTTFVRVVEEQLRDPDSFEHIETRITPVKDGKHNLIMEYRAKNGFGGYTVGLAVGIVDNASCSATLLSLD